LEGIIHAMATIKYHFLNKRLYVAEHLFRHTNVIFVFEANLDTIESNIPFMQFYLSTVTYASKSYDTIMEFAL
jgi:hypothetical protein